MVEQVPERKDVTEEWEKDKATDKLLERQAKEDPKKTSAWEQEKQQDADKKSD